MTEFKRISHTFLSGRLSATLIIPIDIARKYGMEKPTNVVVEERDEGILIKKVTNFGTRNMIKIRKFQVGLGLAPNPTMT